MSLQVSIAQIAPVWEEPEQTLLQAEGMIREAARRGSSLVCFPEQFATGWSPQSIRFAESLEGRIISELSRYAEEYSIAILGSFVEAQDGRPHNTCVAIDASGSLLGTYAKIHLFSAGGEHEHYSAGDNLLVFDIGGIRFGVAICYDLRYPDLFLLYARRGVECMLVPAAWPCSRMIQWEILLRARALDNQYYVAGINSSGETPVDRYCGGSLAADPIGTLLARGGEGEELLEFSVDAGRVVHAREKIPASRDRRDDLYRRLMREVRGNS